jgi:sterol desaturase/sphingolipid hydroxylase (fatty acid hydroxylase superfamily)
MTASRIVRWLVLIALLAAGVVFGFRDSVVAGVVVFALVVPFEKLFRRHDQPIRRPGLATDLAHVVARPVLAPIGIVVAIVVGALSFAWLPGLALRPLVGALPGWAQFVAGFALFDLAAYWAHRWSHEVPFVWRFHSVHHSAEHLDWVSGFRVHPVDGALLAPPFFLLLGAGFSPEATGILAVASTLVGLFLHANVRWRLRPLQRIVATPEFHHWHHANDADAWWTNYSGLLPVWDILFGTYRVPGDQRPEVYGVDAPVPPDLVGQLAWPLRGLPSVGWTLRHPVRAVRRTWAAARRGVGQVWRSSTRPRRPVPVPF